MINAALDTTWRFGDQLIAQGEKEHAQKNTLTVRAGKADIEVMHPLQPGTATSAAEQRE